MLKKIATVWLISGGLLICTAMGAQAQEKAASPTPVSVTQEAPLPPAEPVVVADPAKEPPKVDRNQRRMGMGGDAVGGGRGVQPPQISIFAFPGTKCPAGSGLYKGPETKMAAADNAVYCVFVKEVIILPKGGNGCVGRLEPYKDATIKPDDDVIWCKKIPFGADAPGPKGGPGKVKKVF